MIQSRPYALFGHSVVGRPHPMYAWLASAPHHQSARDHMQALFERMGDPNGNFIRDFQGSGFHSRMFELACFAYLEEGRFAIDRSFASPDFMASRDSVSVAVEAVTANPSHDQAADISLAKMERLTDEQVFNKVNVESAKRIVSSLSKKLAHRYHDLAHCRGKPLVLAIAPFFEAGSVFCSDDALFFPLFGGPREWTNVIEPFFHRPEARAISAVLYCNQFTVARFLRLGSSFADGPMPTMIREGKAYQPEPDESYSLWNFRHLVGGPDTPKETWADGVTVFENPFAEVPVPRELLPATSRVFVEDGYVSRVVYGFHPVVSFTRIAPPETTDGGREASIPPSDPEWS